MFCNKCGSQIPDGTKFCTNCGNRINTGQNQSVKVLDNLFSRISSDFNSGIKIELILWILCCISAILFFINIIIGSGSGWSYKINSMRVIWVFMIMADIGMGVLMALRFRGINIIYANTAFYFIMLIPYYIKERYLFELLDNWFGSNTAISVNIFFALSIINALALVICISLDIFTRIRIKLVVIILSIVMFCLTLCMIFFPYILLLGTGAVMPEYFGVFIMGSVTYLAICCVTSVYTVLYFKGIIDNNEKMFARFNAVAGQYTVLPPVQGQAMPGIQCIKGSCQGSVFNIKGEVIIGSQPGRANIVLNDSYVSRQHCLVRFNQATGYYEIRDISSNGVFLVNGIRLRKNIYTSCQRETVLCIGSMNQQLKLM